AQVIYDAKFGDIGNTNDQYAEEAFEWLKADAVTVHYAMGRQAMLPFLERKDKGIFVLCRTSNDGSEEFQDIIVDVGTGPMPLFLYVVHRVQHFWNYNGNCGLVVGATYLGDLMEVRRKAPAIPILIPGIGDQGGDLRNALLCGATKQKNGILPTASRSIMFSDNPKEEVQKLTGLANTALALMK